MPSGGKRPGAGRPRKALSARVEEGIDKVSHRKPKIIALPPENQNSKIKQSKPAPIFLEMTGKEGDSSIPTATEIYHFTLEWVTDMGCVRHVPPMLIEDFAFIRRSYLECEYMSKKLGRVMQGGKASPYVRHALEYAKQATAYYREIWTIVAQNSTSDFTRNGSNAFLELLKNRGF